MPKFIKGSITRVCFVDQEVELELSPELLASAEEDGIDISDSDSLLSWAGYTLQEFDYKSEKLGAYIIEDGDYTVVNHSEFKE